LPVGRLGHAHSFDVVNKAPVIAVALDGYTRVALTSWRLRNSLHGDSHAIGLDKLTFVETFTSVDMR
jgi:hypothetical protein